MSETVQSLLRIRHAAAPPAGALLTAWVLVTGCTATDRTELEAGPPGVATPYEATGTEPGWHLEITGQTLNLAARYGETRVEAPAPDPQRRDGRLVYSVDTADHQLTVEIRHTYCTNAMSGKPFPDTVTIVLDGERYDGCGGDTAALLTGDSWQVSSLDGRPVEADQPPTLQFDGEGTVTGSDGCNRYRGTYRITGIGVEVSGLAGTRMSCMAPRDELARRFLALLESTRTFRLDGRGRLVLEAADGNSLVAERK